MITLLRKVLKNLSPEPKPTNLKDYLNAKFEDRLISLSFPNAGTYGPGSRTTKQPNKNM